MRNITFYKRYLIVKVLLILLLLPITYALATDIDVGFSPSQGSLDLVLKTINSAKQNICMATYSFTSRPVVDALMAAKKRGVSIKIVSDEKANDKKYTATHYLVNHDINVRLNSNYAIMHNKFIVVDNQTVETGSFNYSEAAVKKNAENVIELWNNRKVAVIYNTECNRLFNEATTMVKNY